MEKWIDPNERRIFKKHKRAIKCNECGRYNLFKCLFFNRKPVPEDRNSWMCSLTPKTKGYGMRGCDVNKRLPKTKPTARFIIFLEQLLLNDQGNMCINAFRDDDDHGHKYNGCIPLSQMKISDIGYRISLTILDWYSKKELFWYKDILYKSVGTYNYACQWSLQDQFVEMKHLVFHGVCQKGIFPDQRLLDINLVGLILDFAKPGKHSDTTLDRHTERLNCECKSCYIDTMYNCSSCRKEVFRGYFFGDTCKHCFYKNRKPIYDFCDCSICNWNRPDYEYDDYGRYEV